MPPKEKKSKLAAIFAFGTRGDVQSLLLLLKHLSFASSDSVDFHFILVTHQTFVNQCESFFFDLKETVTVLGFDSAPVGVSSFDENFLCQNYIDVFMNSVRSSKVDLIMCNFFALPAWKLAVKLKTSCIIIHPCKPLQNEIMKTHLLSAIPFDHPWLYAYLQSEMSKSDASYLNWTDYNDWLWPTLVDNNDEYESFLAALIYANNATGAIVQSNKTFNSIGAPNACNTYDEGTIPDHLYLPPPGPIILLTCSPYLFPPLTTSTTTIISATKTASTNSTPDKAIFLEVNKKQKLHHDSQYYNNSRYFTCGFIYEEQEEENNNVNVYNTIDFDDRWFDDDSSNNYNTDNESSDCCKSTTIVSDLVSIEAQPQKPKKTIKEMIRLDTRCPLMILEAPIQKKNHTNYDERPGENINNDNNRCIQKTNTTTINTDMLLTVLQQTNKLTIAVDTICIDFGSMTEVIIALRDVTYFLRSLLELCNNWRFVWICHGHARILYEKLYRTWTEEYNHNNNNQYRKDTVDGTGSNIDKNKNNSNITTTTTDTNANDAARIVLVSGSVHHRAVWKHCVTVIHHGGVGTIGTCLRTGIPQVVVPIMYDQSTNGLRIQELKLGVVLLPKRSNNNNDADDDDIFPTATVTTANIDNSNVNIAKDVYYNNDDNDFDNSINNNSSGTYMTTSNSNNKNSRISKKTAAVIHRIKVAIQYCSSAAQRLRCACKGRDLRADPCENGLKNALFVIQTELSRMCDREVTSDTI